MIIFVTVYEKAHEKETKYKQEPKSYSLKSNHRLNIKRNLKHAVVIVFIRAEKARLYEFVPLKKI